MDGYSFAKDGERAISSPCLAGLGAPSVAPSPSSRVFCPSSSGGINEIPSWIQDHEAIAQWLTSMTEDERAPFMARVAANIAELQRCQAGFLEPGTDDTALSYAILIEYAQHLGISPVDVCWTFEHTNVESVDPLLGIRVDRMLDDAQSRRSEPRRKGEDGAAPTRAPRGLSAHWRAAGSGRRGRERRADVLATWSSQTSQAFHPDSNRRPA